MQISGKLQFVVVMIFTILMIGCTTTTNSTFSSSSARRRSSSNSSVGGTVVASQSVTNRQSARRTRYQRSTGSTNPTTQQLEAEYAQNIALVSSLEWKCGIPKPRLVYKSEAIGPASRDELNRSHIRWLVTTTVLHRCEPALGCCVQGACSVDTWSDVTITFKALDEQTHDSFYPRLEFRNHTSCKCVTHTHT